MSKYEIGNLVQVEFITYGTPGTPEIRFTGVKSPRIGVETVEIIGRYQGTDDHFIVLVPSYLMEKYVNFTPWEIDNYRIKDHQLDSKYKRKFGWHLEEKYIIGLANKERKPCNCLEKLRKKLACEKDSLGSFC